MLQNSRYTCHFPLASWRNSGFSGSPILLARPPNSAAQAITETYIPPLAEADVTAPETSTSAEKLLAL